MDSIDNAHIRRLDLTLLVVFEMLLKKRNMSAVAAEMGLTQSAVSHAVGRLRSVFDDPLFVRKGAGVEPTARARLLGPFFFQAEDGIRDAVQLGQNDLRNLCNHGIRCRHGELARSGSRIKVPAELDRIAYAVEGLSQRRTKKPGARGRLHAGPLPDK